METFLHAVASVTIILLLTATGYFCAVKGWMTVQVKTFISRYLMTVGIPVMLIYGMQNNLTRADVLAAPRLLLIPLLVIPSCVVLSLLAGRLMRLPHRQLGVFVMMSAMGNTIFIGLAMCLELFGDVATPYVMLFYLVSSCFTQLIGIPLVRWSGEAGGFSMQMVWKFLRAPTVVSVFLSLLLVGLDIHLPSLVMSYAKYINNTVTPLALLLTVLLGVAIEKAAYKPLRTAPRMSVMISAIGVSYLLQNLANYITGGIARAYPDIPFLTQVLNIGGLNIKRITIVTPILTIALVAVLVILIQKTKIGMAMRAVSRDFETSQLMGIKINSVISMTFVIGSFLAAVASILYFSNYGQVSPMIGAMPGLKAFVAAVFGGIGSIPGAVIGAFIIGICESFIKANENIAVFSNAFTFALLIVILLCKPNGLFGEKLTEKV